MPIAALMNASLIISLMNTSDSTWIKATVNGADGTVWYDFMETVVKLHYNPTQVKGPLSQACCIRQDIRNPPTFNCGLYVNTTSTSNSSANQMYDFKLYVENRNPPASALLSMAESAVYIPGYLEYLPEYGCEDYPETPLKSTTDTVVRYESSNGTSSDLTQSFSFVFLLIIAAAVVPVIACIVFAVVRRRRHLDRRRLHGQHSSSSYPNKDITSTYEFDGNVQISGLLTNPVPNNMVTPN